MLLELLATRARDEKVAQAAMAATASGEGTQARSK